jgi:HSP20 family protein
MTTLGEPVAASWLCDLTRYQTDEGGRTWRRIEREFGRFERDVRVPKGLEPDSIEASLEDGVLTLRVRKPEPLKPQRIEIGGGEASEEPKHVEGATA